jgi:hypothetical protein
MEISKSGKIMIGISVAVIGYLLYKQYISKKIDNAVKGIDNADAGNSGTTNPAIATNCKTLAPYLKKCQTIGKSVDSTTSFWCDKISPYQKLCASYI